jgi:hypothetical protein
MELISPPFSRIFKARGFKKFKARGLNIIKQRTCFHVNVSNKKMLLRRERLCVKFGVESRKGTGGGSAAFADIAIDRLPGAAERLHIDGGQMKAIGGEAGWRDATSSCRIRHATARRTN